MNELQNKVLNQSVLLLQACGPITMASLMNELCDQVPGINRQNAEVWATTTMVGY